MWWLAGSPTKVDRKDFRGGYRFSKIGKDIRKKIPRRLLNTAEKKTLFKVLDKRKNGALSKLEVEGAVRELIKNKSDNISRTEAIDLVDHLENVTGYKNLRWHGSLAEKYSNVDKEGSPSSKLKSKNQNKDNRTSENLDDAKKSGSVWKNLFSRNDTKESKKESTRNPNLKRPINIGNKKNKTVWSNLFSKNSKRDNTGNKKESQGKNDVERLRLANKKLRSDRKYNEKISSRRKEIQKDKNHKNSNIGKYIP